MSLRKSTGRARAGFIWVFSGTVIKAASQWGILFLLIRHTGLQQAGEYGLALSLVLPIVVTANLRLSQLQATDISKTFRFGDYMATRWITTLVATVAIVILVLALNLNWALRFLALAVGIRLLMHSLIEVFSGLFLQKGRLDKYGQALVYSYGIAFVAFASAIAFGWSLVASFLLASVALLIPLFAHNVPSARLMLIGAPAEDRRFLPRWEPATQRRLFRLAVPMGGLLLLESLATNVPRYVLAAFAGTFELGILMGLLTVLSAGSLFNEAILQTLVPRITNLYAANDKSSLRALLIGISYASGILTSLIILISWFVGPAAIGAMLSSEYKSYRWSLVSIALMFGIQLITRVVGIVLTAARIIDANTVVGGVALACTALFSFLLIPRWGVSGAFFAMNLAAIIRLLVMIVLIVRFFSQWTAPEGATSDDQPGSLCALASSE